MHADRPGDRPRLLYWYRTAPGIILGRAPLDEDAIRTIREALDLYRKLRRGELASHS